MINRYEGKSVRLGVLASGSRGNAFVVEHDGSAVFIDAGLSGKRHMKRMIRAGFDDIRPLALLLSHEHSDHVSGAGVIARKWSIPVVATNGTVVASRGKLGKVPEIEILPNGSTVDFGSFTVSAFSVPHDAADPSGFIVRWDAGKLGIATDLGRAGPLVHDSLSNCTAVVLEFNHDEDMLWEGSYPWRLKQRIASTTGHLSNCAASRLLSAVWSRELRTCVLAHLSQENNLPHLAEKASRKVAGGSVSIHTGMQDESLPALHI
ncbi:MAG: MBL fold metallo-hydrolase [Candidatus Aegiribacteria sp.]|nr:MBL fold metallo-hydrolase [Candidatus Aegiribacteria sp.]MBD3294786.1 MBL fold metallo-hydrolase [Candidatus Fermentibacteria bacterium]